MTDKATIGRREALKVTGVAAGILVSGSQLGGALSHSQSDQVTLSEMVLQYDLREEPGSKYFFEECTVCETPDYYVDEERNTVEIRDTPRKAEVNRLLGQARAIINFGGIAPFSQKAVGGGRTLTPVSKVTQDLRASKALVLDEPVNVPRFTVGLDQREAVIRHKTQELRVPSGHKREITLPEQELQVRTLEVKEEKAPLRDGMEEWHRSQKTIRGVKSVRIQPKLTVSNLGELNITQ